MNALLFHEEKLFSNRLIRNRTMKWKEMGSKEKKFEKIQMNNTRLQLCDEI